MTEPSLRKQVDRIVLADGVEDELVEIFTTAWEAERKNIGRGIAPPGTKTRAGLRAVYEALLDKLGAPDLTPSQQATVERFGVNLPNLSAAILDSLTTPQAPDPYPPRADGRVCKHCRQRITEGEFPVHSDGDYTGKQRCDPADSGLEYGYNADPIGAPCNGICLGATRPPQNGEAR